jgi:hypothetical protein
MKCRRTKKRFDWNGVRIEVVYEPEWLGDGELAHIEIRSLVPPKAPLPITETGYRSHFTTPSVIDEAGGSVAFVREWLDIEAATPRWRRLEAAARQLSLF